MNKVPDPVERLYDDSVSIGDSIAILAKYFQYIAGPIALLVTIIYSLV